MLPWLEAWVPLLKDLVTAGVALGGLRVAWLGVDAWKRQLRGQTEYDLARRLLRATLDVRDAVARLRSPMVFAAEMQRAAADAGYESPTDFRQRMDDRQPYILALLARIRDLNRYESAFDIEALEAEVVFGERAREAAHQLRKASRGAAIAVHVHVQDEHHGASRVKDHHEHLLKAFAGTGEEDMIANELAAAVNAIENVARPHLTDASSNQLSVRDFLPRRWRFRDRSTPTPRA